MLFQKINEADWKINLFKDIALVMVKGKYKRLIFIETSFYDFIDDVASLKANACW